jgi:hypothetical protein
MKLNCVSCGHTLDLHEDYDDYDGQIRCYVCGGLVMIHTENGNVKHAALISETPHDSDAKVHSVTS